MTSAMPETTPVSEMGIEPCPFCGGEAFLNAPKGMFSNPFYRVCCTKCGAEGPRFHEATCDTPNESAIAAWNARALSTRTPEAAQVEPDVRRRLESVATTLETCGKHGIPIDFAMLASDIRAALAQVRHPLEKEG